MDIQNQKILITGGGSGIGKALTKSLYEKSNTLIVIGRNLKKLQKLKTEFPKIIHYSCDLSLESETKALIQLLIQEHPDLNILINNAGIMEIEDFIHEEINEAIMVKQVDTNFYAPVRLTHGLLPTLMKNPNPAIVNVSTALVYVPFAATPSYCASKAALSSYTHSLRIQYQNQPLKVFEVLPPLVQTDMAKSLGKNGMDVSQFADQVLDGLKRDQFIIRPGQAKILYVMHKFLGGLIQKQMNKSAFQVLNA